MLTCFLSSSLLLARSWNSNVNYHNHDKLK